MAEPLLCLSRLSHSAPPGNSGERSVSAHFVCVSGRCLQLPSLPSYPTPAPVCLPSPLFLKPTSPDSLWPLGLSNFYRPLKALIQSHFSSPMKPFPLCLPHLPIKWSLSRGWTAHFVILLRPWFYLVAYWVAFVSSSQPPSRTLLNPPNQRQRSSLRWNGKLKEL